MEHGKRDVVVAGGGITGLFCAYYLAGEGHAVTVLERDRVGSGASHGNCGLLMFSDVPPLCSPGTVQYEIRRQLKGISPMSIRPGLDPSLWGFLLRFAMNCNQAQWERASRARQSILELSRGLFQDFFREHPFRDRMEKGYFTLCRTRKDFDKHLASNRALTRFGLEAEPLDRERLQAREPAVGDGVYGGFHHPGDQSLRPDGLLRHVREILEAAGVTVHEGCGVTGFRRSGARVTALETPAGTVSADQFVIAAGAWSVPVMGRLGIHIPVQPGKGYSITMHRPGICPAAPVYFSERSVVATPFDQGFRLGGTMEFSGWDASLNRRRLEALRKAAPEYLKEPFGHPVVEEWTSFRPMSVDDLPIISRVPGLDNLLLATGHGMLGITLATGTGRLVARMLRGAHTGIPAAPFSLDRFRLRG
jgi:D-amino-acid dehydrogenase